MLAIVLPAINSIISLFATSSARDEQRSLARHARRYAEKQACNPVELMTD
jgi:hypothetical protein